MRTALKCSKRRQHGDASVAMWLFMSMKSSPFQRFYLTLVPVLVRPSKAHLVLRWTCSLQLQRRMKVSPNATRAGHAAATSSHKRQNCR